jgi:catechol 2,3-dioxygenase-like lactoylglutathione lyase family enzyme
MSQGGIEHVNLTVTDIERSAALFERLLGWRRRWRGEAMRGGETIHVGDDRTYLALYTDRRDHAGQAKGRPLNHVGLLVDDLDAAERVVAEHGLAPFGHDDYAPGRRFYFFDWDGIEFEVVSYA